MTVFVELKDVADIQMGTAPPGTSYNEVGEGLPMIAGAGDYGNIYPEPKKWTTAPTRITSVGDLIVCVRATIGDLNWADKEYCLGRGVAGIRAKPGISDIRYLAHFIASKKAELTKLGTGSTFLAIRRDDLRTFPVPLLPLKEQKRIAAILDKADAIRSKRQQSIELADQFLRSVFLDMFGDPVVNPKGLKVMPMTEVFDITTGKLDSNAAVEGGKYPFFTCAKQVSAIDKYAFDMEALLLAGNNAQAIYDVKHYHGKFNAYQRTYVLTLKDQSWSYPFFQFALEDQLANLKRVSKGSNTKYITLEIMGRTMLPVPTVSEQKQFVNFFNQVNNAKSSMQTCSLNASHLFDSLSQRAFNGELRESRAA